MDLKFLKTKWLRIKTFLKVQQETLTENNDIVPVCWQDDCNNSERRHMRKAQVQYGPSVTSEFCKVEKPMNKLTEYESWPEEVSLGSALTTCLARPSFGMANRPRACVDFICMTMFEFIVRELGMVSGGEYVWETAVRRSVLQPGRNRNCSKGGFPTSVATAWLTLSHFDRLLAWSSLNRTW